MKTIIISVIYIVLFSISLNAQTEIDVFNGDWVSITCNSLNPPYQWQISYDSLNWEDIYCENADTITREVEETAYYRLKSENGIKYSSFLLVKVNGKTKKVENFYVTYERWAYLKNCTTGGTGLTGYYNVGVCKAIYEYTLQWDLDLSNETLISIDADFLPEDGVSYSTSDSRIIFCGKGSILQVKDQFAGMCVDFYVYTYNKEKIYSNASIYEVEFKYDDEWLTPYTCEACN